MESVKKLHVGEDGKYSRQGGATFKTDCVLVLKMKSEV